MLKIKKRNIKKDAKFSGLSRSARLYGTEPIWKVTLKVASTGLLTSFFLGLFTFVDQLMLVNFMPNTDRFSFNTLFYQDGNGVFKNFLNYINSSGGSEIYQQIIKDSNNPNSATLSNLINAISNATGLGFVNSATIVRSAVSLTTALSIIINAIPSLFSVGSAVKYTQAIGMGDYKKAAYIWQNSFVGCIVSGLLCFCLLVILIPTVIPAQNVPHQLNNKDMYALGIAIEKRFANNGWGNAPYIQDIINSIHKNGLRTSTIFYTFDSKTGIFTYYVQISKNEYLNISADSGNSLITVNKSNVTLLQTNQQPSYFTYNLIGDSKNNSDSSLLSTWGNYRTEIHTLTNRWAENFLWILAAACTIFSLANLLQVVLRAEGAISATTIISIVTVVINIILDFVFIKIAQIGMEGAACASVVGWVIEVVWFGLYLEYSKKIHPHANFTLLSKKYLNINWKIMQEIILFGLSMLIGTVTYSVSNIILTNQVTYVSSKVLIGNGSEYYLSILGAITPLLNLFYFTIFGLVRSNSPIFSYNYSTKSYSRFREAYWYNIGLIVSVALIILGLFGFCEPIKVEILSWFHITKSSPDYQLQSASKLLWIWLTEIPMLGLATGGMLIYRSSNRIGTSYVVALLRSCIYSIPIIFIFGAIAVQDSGNLNSALLNEYHSEAGIPAYENAAGWFFFYNVPVSTACYSITIFIMSTVYIYKYLEHPRKVSQIWPYSIFVKHYYKKLFNESKVNYL